MLNVSQTKTCKHAYCRESLFVFMFQETSEQISSMFDESGAILNEDCGGTAEQLIDVVMKLQAQLYGTDKRNMKEEPQAQENKPQKWYSHDWPKNSATDVVFIDLSEEASNERIAALLGGGDVVRDVRRSGGMTFVAFYTPYGANDAVDFGLKCLHETE